MDWCEECLRAEIGDRYPDAQQFAHPDARHDSPPTCVECGQTLAGWLTNYGAREELATMEEHGFDPASDYDCYLWMPCENSFVRDSDEYRRLLALLLTLSKE